MSAEGSGVSLEIRLAKCLSERNRAKENLKKIDELLERTANEMTLGKPPALTQAQLVEFRDLKRTLQAALESLNDTFGKVRWAEGLSTTLAGNHGNEITLADGAQYHVLPEFCPYSRPWPLGRKLYVMQFHADYGIPMVMIYDAESGFDIFAQPLNG